MIDNIIEMIKGMMFKTMLEGMKKECEQSHYELFQTLNDPDHVRTVGIAMAEAIAAAATKRYKELGGEVYK